MKTLRMVKGDVILIEHIETAFTFFSRLKGLLGRDTLGGGRGLHIAPCNAIHTIGMRFTIDLIFLDKDFKVTSIRRNVRPGSVVAGARGSHSVVEIGAGWFDWDRLAEGDTVRFVES